MWKAALEAIDCIREQAGLSRPTDVSRDVSLIKDIDPGDSPATQAISDAHYLAIDNEPDMVLRLDPSWRTHADYLAGMTSKYRRSCEKVLRWVKGAGFRIERLTDVRRNAGVLHRHYLSVQRQARLRPVALPADFLPELSQALGRRFRCFVIRDCHARIVAFVTTIRDGDTLAGYFLGYDPEVNRTVPLYLRLLHAVVEEALRTRCRRISFGRTALEAKARLGAKPTPLNIWVQHGQPSLHAWANRWLQASLFEKVPLRRPFG